MPAYGSRAFGLPIRVEEPPARMMLERPSKTPTFTLYKSRQRSYGLWRMMSNREADLKPSAFELFCMYYLGLGPDFRPRFYNVNAIARHFGVSADEIQKWLEGFGMKPEVFRHIDYNVAKAHGKAQDIGLTAGASTDDTRAFAKETFEQFRRALKGYSPNKVFEDIDYDDIWKR
jgi:hypothetical protein